MKRPIIIVTVVVILIAGWLAFRPELLFVNKHVDEPLPTSTSMLLRAPNAVRNA